MTLSNCSYLLDKARAEIDRLKEENAALKAYGAKCRAVIQAEAMNGLYQTHRANDAEHDLFKAERELFWYRESLFDLACLYERLWEKLSLYKRGLIYLRKRIETIKHEDVDPLRTRLAEAHEALEWYGDEDQYKRHTSWDPPNGERIVWYPVLKDRGQRAREARK